MDRVGFETTTSAITFLSWPRMKWKLGKKKSYCPNPTCSALFLYIFWLIYSSSREVLRKDRAAEVLQLIQSRKSYISSDDNSSRYI